MERAIVGYHQDEQGDWVAHLACGHRQHVRHRPPFQERPWVADSAGREARLGTPLDCPLCDRAELPAGLQLVRSSVVWDEGTMPRGLRRAHRVGAGTWGRIVVLDGRLRFMARTVPAIDVVLDDQSVQAVPPEVEHEVSPVGSVRFSIDFLTVPQADTADTPGEGQRHPTRNGPTTRAIPDEGGETACWAHLLCPECGAIVDGGAHLAGCSVAAPP